MTKECEIYIKEKCTRYLLEIGVPANLQGFRYLRDAILIIVKEPKYKRGVTKFLYPEIAEKYTVSVPVVERAMRHAIELACNRRGMSSLNRIFSCSLCDSSFKPSISELISILAEKLIADMNEWVMTHSVE